MVEKLSVNHLIQAVASSFKGFLGQDLLEESIYAGAISLKEVLDDDQVRHMVGCQCLQVLLEQMLGGRVTAIEHVVEAQARLEAVQKAVNS